MVASQGPCVLNVPRAGNAIGKHHRKVHSSTGKHETRFVGAHRFPSRSQTVATSLALARCIETAVEVCRVFNCALCIDRQLGNLAAPAVYFMPERLASRPFQGSLGLNTAPAGRKNDHKSPVSHVWSHFEGSSSQIKRVSCLEPFLKEE